jgi:butyrate kinase
MRSNKYQGKWLSEAAMSEQRPLGTFRTSGGVMGSERSGEMDLGEVISSFLESEGQTADEFLREVIDVGGDLAVAVRQKIHRSIVEKDRRRLERILAFADLMPDARTAYVLKVEAYLREGRIDFN